MSPPPSRPPKEVRERMKEAARKADNYEMSENEDSDWSADTDDSDEHNAKKSKRIPDWAKGAKLAQVRRGCT